MVELLPEITQARKLTPRERAALGKAARKRAPRSSHARWEVDAARPDPVGLLEEQAADRVSDLVPIRYGRMLVSPGTFYRGGALLMATDLAGTPDSGLRAQLCGDAHLLNFGLFQSPERRLVFDINDFDETLPGPWEWDVKRLAASFEIAARDRGFPAATRRSIVLHSVRAYREAMHEMAEKRAIQLWYTRLDADLIREHVTVVGARDARRMARDMSRAEMKDDLRALSRLTCEVEGKTRLRSAPPLLVPARELLEGDERARFTHSVEQALRAYRETLPRDRRAAYDLYRYRDMARKVVGVGSVGTRAWVLLFFGRDEGDPLFLQAKQAQASVLERFVGRSRFRGAGRRVVEGQRLMQAVGDILLGWYSVTGFDGRPYDFYVRQLWDGKGSFNVTAMTEGAWHTYAEMCSWVLARAHSRSGDRIAIAAYLGGADVFDRAVADFADAYAEQNQRDYDALRAAVDSGRVSAQGGVCGADRARRRRTGEGERDDGCREIRARESDRSRPRPAPLREPLPGVRLRPRRPRPLRQRPHRHRVAGRLHPLPPRERGHAERVSRERSAHQPAAGSGAGPVRALRLPVQQRAVGRGLSAGRRR